MGRKKGRQRGDFATKAQSAAQRTLVRERASEADVDRRPYRGGWSASSSLPSSPSSSFTSSAQLSKSGIRAGASSATGERPRITVSVTQLQGILAERRLQDRALDGEMRRFLAQQGTTVRSEAAGRYAALMRLREGGVGGSEEGAACGDASTPRHEPGWLLTYEHGTDFVPNEFAATARSTGGESVEGELDASVGGGTSEGASCSDPGRTRRRRHPPSLQCMCVSALAPALDDYVESCGPDAVRSVLDLMPSHVLADLSALYCGTTGGAGDDMAAVLGCHGQAERLALHAPAVEDSDDDEEEDGHGDDDNDRERAPHRGYRHMSDAGVLSLIPRLVSAAGAGTVEYAYDAPDSWEDLDVDYSAPAATLVSPARLEGCTNLRRLELCGARRLSALALSSLLRRCSRITHLSLSGTLDAESGPASLLDPNDGIAALLPELRVLDLSRCGWLTDGILVAFLFRALPVAMTKASSTNEAAPPPSSLEMVSVSGSSGVTLAAVEELNGRLGGAPYVSTVPQRRRRSRAAQLEEEEEERERWRRSAAARRDRGSASRGELVAVKRWKDRHSSRIGCSNRGAADNTSGDA